MRLHFQCNNLYFLQSNFQYVHTISYTCTKRLTHWTTLSSGSKIWAYQKKLFTGVTFLKSVHVYGKWYKITAQQYSHAYTTPSSLSDFARSGSCPSKLARSCRCILCLLARGHPDALQNGECTCIYPETHWFISFGEHQPHEIKLKWVTTCTNLVPKT